jgi:hypothetical protein
LGVRGIKLRYERDHKRPKGIIQDVLGVRGIEILKRDKKRPRILIFRTCWG